VACELLLLFGKWTAPLQWFQSRLCETISADYVFLQECGGEFEDGRYFLRGESDDPVCVKCEERRLKA
jgi:hypothetical protein